MASRRWMLVLLSLTSLVVLTYAGVIQSFSLPVTAEVAGDISSARIGERAVVVPIVAPERVPTLATNETPAILMSGVKTGFTVSTTRDAHLGRALAYVPAGANETLTYANETYDLALLSEGHEGWLLVGEDDAGARFVHEADLVGEVARYEKVGLLASLFAAGLVGFIAPLIAIVLTHRGGTRAGVAEVVCRECRSPTGISSEFCMRCGAWLRSKE